MARLRGSPLPNLCASWITRYDMRPGDVTPTTPRPSQGLESPLVPRTFFRLKRLSPVAKLDEVGQPQEDFPYELPPQGILRMIIAAYHPTGVMPPGLRPFKLRARGLVNFADAQAHKPGLISPDFDIIP